MSDHSSFQESPVLIKKIFISEDESRLRAGWRLLLQTVLMLVIGSCVSFPLIFYFALNGKTAVNVYSIGVELLLPLQIAEFFIFTSSVYVARRFLDKRSFVSLGLALNRWVAWDIMIGFVVSFIIIGFTFVLQFGVGWVRIDGFAWETESIPGVIKASIAFLIIFGFTGWNEELLSRGYHLQTISSGSNTFWGVVISSIIFGISHIGNPNAAWTSIVGIFLAGLLFAYAYLRSGQLWLSMGLHFGWNFFEGVVFGFPVSGLEIYKLMRIQVVGPELWTGGLFGPEAGLIVIPALILGAVLIYFYTKIVRKSV